jgi:hypothetical protein
MKGYNGGKSVCCGNGERREGTEENKRVKFRKTIGAKCRNSKMFSHTQPFIHFLLSGTTQFLALNKNLDQ